eukprot:1105614-Amphidinium_carterae.1
MTPRRRRVTQAARTPTRDLQSVLWNSNTKKFRSECGILCGKPITCMYEHVSAQEVYTRRLRVYLRRIRAEKKAMLSTHALSPPNSPLGTWRGRSWVQSQMWSTRSWHGDVQNDVET